MRALLHEAFVPYRSAYTAGAFDDTVPSPAGLRARLRRMVVLVAEDGEGEIVGDAGGGRGAGRRRPPAWHGGGRGARGGGLARDLLANACDWARSRGCGRVKLETTAPLRRAIRFYEREGFRPTGRVRDFFGMPLHEYARPLEG